MTPEKRAEIIKKFMKRFEGTALKFPDLWIPPSARPSLQYVPQALRDGPFVLERPNTLNTISFMMDSMLGMVPQQQQEKMTWDYPVYPEDL